MTHGVEQARIFWPRTSEVIGSLAIAMEADPESPLSDSDKQVVLAFEANLFAGRYTSCEMKGGLEALPSTADSTVEFVPAYFLTPKGRKQLEIFIGRNCDATTAEEIAQALYALPFASLRREDKDEDKKLKAELESLSGDSKGYAREYYADAASRGDDVEDLLSITLHRNPQQTLQKFVGLREYKAFLQNVRADLREVMDQDPSTVTDAKLVITDIYRDKINAELASRYPGLQSLLRQYEAQQTKPPQVAELIGQLTGTVAIARRAALDAKRQATFVRRLDHVRNGAAYDKDGNMTPVDARIYDDVDAVNKIHALKARSTALFNQDEVERLSSIKLDGAALQALAAEYIAALGAEGWEAVVRQDATSLSVAAKTKQVKIPKDYNSGLVRPGGQSGAIGILQHEVGGDKPGHVLQSINAERNTDSLRLAADPKYRGKRYTVLREAGGIAAEMYTAEHYFGQQRTMSAAYARALESLIAGSTISEAVRVFADTTVAGKDTPTKEEYEAAIKLGADRVLRLKRYGGFNSQPLAYVEAATVLRVIDGMDEDQERTLLAEATLDPVDMERLRRFDLLQSNPSSLFKTTRNPQEYIVDYLRNKLQHTLADESA